MVLGIVAIVSVLMFGEFLQQPSAEVLKDLGEVLENLGDLRRPLKAVDIDHKNMGNSDKHTRGIRKVALSVRDDAPEISRYNMKFGSSYSLGMLLLLACNSIEIKN